MSEKRDLAIVALSSSESQPGNYVLILEDLEQQRRIPIIIGMPEAQSIAIAMEQMQPARPMTHDLLKSVMVGLGGVLTEVLSDVAFALAPCSPATAERLLRSLHASAIFGGVRGRPPVDVAALARLVSSVADVAAAHPEIGELEVNPVLVSPDGVLALDARAVAP